MAGPIDLKTLPDPVGAPTNLLPEKYRSAVEVANTLAAEKPAPEKPRTFQEVLRDTVRPDPAVVQDALDAPNSQSRLLTPNPQSLPQNYSLPKLIDQLKEFEGVRVKPYKDSLGIETIGVGRNLVHKGFSKDEMSFLLGSRPTRDFNQEPLTKFETDALLMNDIREAEASLDQTVPWWRNLSETRQRVLLDMRFNLGEKNFLGFKKALGAVQVGDYKNAALEMLHSKWATQVGRRARVLAAWMFLGKEEA